jgi:hypothetical protein
MRRGCEIVTTQVLSTCLIGACAGLARRRVRKSVLHNNL